MALDDIPSYIDEKDVKSQVNDLYRVTLEEISPDDPKIEVNILEDWSISIEVNLWWNLKAQLWSWKWIHTKWETEKYIDDVVFSDDKRNLFLNWSDLCVSDAYLAKIESALWKTFDKKNLKAFNNWYTVEIIWATKWYRTAESINKKWAIRDRYWYAYYDWPYSSQALSSSRAQAVVPLVKKLFPEGNVTVVRWFFDQEKNNRTNSIKINLIPNKLIEMEVVENKVEHILDLPPVLDISDWEKELMSALQLPEFEFDPLLYSIWYETLISYENNLYESDDDRFERKYYPYTDPEGNELDIEYEFSYQLDWEPYTWWVKRSERKIVRKSSVKQNWVWDWSRSPGWSRIQTTYRTTGTPRRKLSLKTKTTFTYARDVPEKWVRARSEYIWPVIYPKEDVTHIESWKKASLEFWRVPSFDKDDVLLKEMNETKKTLWSILRYLKENPDKHITICSSASYAWERPWRGIFLNYFSTILRERSLWQSKRIKYSLSSLSQKEFNDRIHILWLWEEWAYDQDWNWLWIRTWIVTWDEAFKKEWTGPLLIPPITKKKITPPSPKRNPSLINDVQDTDFWSYSWDDVNKNLKSNEPTSLKKKLFNQDAPKEDVLSNMPIKRYPYLSSPEKLKEVLNNFMKSDWLIWFLTKIQELDWVITIAEKEKILAWAKRFTWVCQSKIKNALDLKWKDRFELKQHIIQYWWHLLHRIMIKKWLTIRAENNYSDVWDNYMTEKERNDIIALFTVLEFFKKHVEYNSTGNFWDTFVGLKTFAKTDFLKNWEKVEMDCDIISILAHEILTWVWVNHTFLIQYNDDGIDDHVNWKVWETIVEWTNIQNYWFENKKRKFIEKNTLLEIWSDFMNTYVVEKNIKDINLIKRYRIAYAMDERNTKRLFLSLENYCITLYNKLIHDEKINYYEIEDLWKVVHMITVLKEKIWGINKDLFDVMSVLFDVLKIFEEEYDVSDSPIWSLIEKAQLLTLGGE